MLDSILIQQIQVKFMEKSPLQEKKEKRFQFLKRLYDMQEENPSLLFLKYEIGDALGFDRKTTDRIADYLDDEGLINLLTNEGGLQIEHAGTVEVEQALENPEKPTEHFPPIQYIVNNYEFNNNGPMTGTQQGTSNSTQTNNITTGNIPELREIINQLLVVSNQLNLLPEARQELTAEIETLQSQTRSPKPKPNIIKEALVSARTIVEGVIINTATGAITDPAGHATAMHAVEMIKMWIKT